MEPTKQKQTTKTSVKLTLEEQVQALRLDIAELARGVNIQAHLLEAMVVAFDTVVKKYLQLIEVPNEKKENPQQADSKKV